MKLIIVESPSKSKTIETYMGKDYKVAASLGHIRDLSTSGKDNLGINITKGFIPDYEIIKGKEAVVSELKKLCKGKEVFLATDPDREGEAISWHLASVLKLDPKLVKRVVFNEITPKAIKEAFDNPKHIDVDLVSSQETRRMLDRIIGFKLSKLLYAKIKSKSAGRVQSSVLKIICDLEKEINDFISTPYYYLSANFSDFKLDLVNQKLEKYKFTDKDEVNNVADSLQKRYVVSDIIEKKQTVESRMPLITSTLQQLASVRYNFSPDRTLRVAQALYEGKALGNEQVGLITYMRTDSARLSDLFVKDALDYIEKTYGNQYKGRAKQKNKASAQDAHEAIRPTDISKTPESVKMYLTSDEYRIYKLIYNATLASLMAPAIFLNTTVLFDNSNYKFKITGRTLLFDGYLKNTGLSEDDQNRVIPAFKVGDEYITSDLKIEQLATKPKPRFTEATLIKEMEDLGIGRPSTYAQTIKTLIARKYISLVERKVVPTEQGLLTNEKLEEFFLTIITPKYTANMESMLDDIAKGSANSVMELQKFYDEFAPLFEHALHTMSKQAEKQTGQLCPKCGEPLVIKNGKFGEFVCCSNYPKCKYVFKEKKEEDDTGIICPECRRGNIIRRLATKGPNKGNYFYSCNRFPKCKTTYEYKPTEDFCPICGHVIFETKDGPKCINPMCGKKEDSTYIKCPKCGEGEIVARVATRGKNAGNTFYACTNYPKCKVIYNNRPTGEKCQVCGEIIVSDGKNSSCVNINCEKYIKLHN